MAIDPVLSYVNLGTTGGTSTAYTATPSPAITSYETGRIYQMKLNASCGASPTLNASSLGAKNVFKATSSGLAACAANDLQNNQILLAIYDGTQFQVINPIQTAGGGGGGGTPLPPYLQISSVNYIPADNMSVATTPSLSGFTTLSGAYTASTLANGDIELFNATSTAAWFGTTAFTTSIEATFSFAGIGNGPACGIWLYDSTASHYVAFDSYIDNSSINYVNGLYVETWSSSFVYGSPLQLGYATGVLHIKLIVGGGNWTAYKIINGDTTHPVGFGSGSIGTVTGMGFMLTSGVMDLMSLIVS